MRMNSEAPLFVIGKDSRGRWIAQDRNGLRGGLFVSRADALKFALFENGNRPEAVNTTDAGQFRRVCDMSDDELEEN